jgi:hypothetical protein
MGCIHSTTPPSLPVKLKKSKYYDIIDTEDIEYISTIKHVSIASPTNTAEENKQIGMIFHVIITFQHGQIYVDSGDKRSFMDINDLCNMISNLTEQTHILFCSTDFSYSGGYCIALIKQLYSTTLITAFLTLSPKHYIQSHMVRMLTETYNDHTLIDYYHNYHIETAVLHNDGHLIKQLNKQQPVTSKMLEFACRHYFGDAIKAILECGIDVHHASAAVELYASSIRPSIDILKLFIKNGVDVNRKNVAGKTILHYLYENNSTDNEVIQELINMGAVPPDS